MKYKLNFRKKMILSVTALIWLVAAGSAAVAYGQNSAAAPVRREQLLNGLKLLMWNDNNPKLTVKLRVHSGSAFDPKGKEGVMRLLADSFFPNEQIKDFFREELGGSLDINSNQDFIEITATGGSDDLERILDTLRNAVVNISLTPDNFKKVRAARLALLQNDLTDTGKIADSAIKKRLYGDFFPYGRPADGTPETLAKIDAVDLIQARERFLTADNATIAVIGNFDQNFALRAVKQFFGNWSKADKSTPATFRQPDAVDKQIQIIKLPSVETAQIRFALRGTSLNSANFAAAAVLTQILRERWQKALPSELKLTANVVHEAHVLPGDVIFSASVTGGFAEPVLGAAQTAFAKILSEPLAGDEFNRAKSSAAAPPGSNSITPVSQRLDEITFKVKTNNRLSAAQTTLAQTQILLAEWQKQTPAVVVVTQAEGNQAAPTQK